MRSRSCSSCREDAQFLFTFGLGLNGQFLGLELGLLAAILHVTIGALDDLGGAFLRIGLAKIVE